MRSQTRPTAAVATAPERAARPAAARGVPATGLRLKSAAGLSFVTFEPGARRLAHPASANGNRLLNERLMTT